MVPIMETEARTARRRAARSSMTTPQPVIPAPLNELVTREGKSLAHI